MMSIKDVDFDTFDFSKPAWFLDHSWTVKEEQSFKDWLYNYLQTNKYAVRELSDMTVRNKTFLRRLVDEIVWNFGWKYSENVFKKEEDSGKEEG